MKESASGGTMGGVGAVVSIEHCDAEWMSPASNESKTAQHMVHWNSRKRQHPLDA